MGQRCTPQVNSTEIGNSTVHPDNARNWSTTRPILLPWLN
jgi:hypothetical protein